MLHFILLFLCINFITSYCLPILIPFFNSVLNIHHYNTRSAVNQFYDFNIRF